MIYTVITMSNTQSIRACNKSDVNALYLLICQLEQEVLPYDSFCAIYLQQLKDEQYYGLVYEQKHHIIAFLHLRLEDQLHHAAKIAEIMELIVAENERSQGIGKALIQRGLRIAKQRGCIQMEVSSHHQRSNAHRFYERCGFQNHHKKFTLKI